MTVYICITMCNCSYNRPFSYYDYFSLDNVPAVTVLLFRDGLTIGLRTSTGHVSSKNHTLLSAIVPGLKKISCFLVLISCLIFGWDHGSLASTKKHSHTLVLPALRQTV